MHNYPPFEMQESADRIAFIQARRFANLIVNGPDGLLAAHIPLLIVKCKDKWVLEGHVARSNPLGSAANGQQGLAIFNGPDAYVAAGFYPSKTVHGKVAPTWNYLAVHAAGPIETFSDPDELVSHLVRLTDFLEAAEPIPWAVNDAPDGFAELLVTRIIGFRMVIESLEGTAKLNQNSGEADRLGVIDGLTLRNNPHERPIIERMQINEQMLAGETP